MKKACENCLHCREHEDMSAYIWSFECAVKKGMSNLVSFPFSDTKCEKYEVMNEPN